MATNIHGETDFLDFTLTANCNSGDLIKAGNLFGIAVTSGSTGDVVALRTGVRASLKKLSGASTSFAVGDNVYWDATNAQATVSATSNLKIGVVLAAAANAATAVTVALNKSW